VRGLLLLLLVLSACRYTFLPLDPGRPPPPERPFVVARLLKDGEEARLVLRVERLPGPGYLHLKWYREGDLLLEKALFLEGPGVQEARFPLKEGYHRLVGLWAGGFFSSWTWGRPFYRTPMRKRIRGTVRKAKKVEATTLRPMRAASLPNSRESKKALTAMGVADWSTRTLVLQPGEAEEKPRQIGEKGGHEEP
jgi:hypothetical protein